MNIEFLSNILVRHGMDVDKATVLVEAISEKEIEQFRNQFIPEDNAKPATVSRQRLTVGKLSMLIHKIDRLGFECYPGEEDEDMHEALMLFIAAVDCVKHHLDLDKIRLASKPLFNKYKEATLKNAVASNEG